MTSIPISEFEHRVAKWIAHLEKTREPLEISQRGRAKLVVLDKTTYDQWKADRELTQALEIKFLVERGLEDIRKGRVYTQEQVEKMLFAADRKRKRKS